MVVVEIVRRVLVSIGVSSAVVRMLLSIPSVTASLSAPGVGARVSTLATEIEVTKPPTGISIL